MFNKYYKRFKIFTSNPLWQMYLINAYKKSRAHLSNLNHNIQNENYTVLLCGTSGIETSKAFIKYQVKKNRDCNIIILDANEYPLQETRIKIERIYPDQKITYVKANALALPFDNKTIDHIETDCFIQFFSSSELIILFREWNRVLKDYGYISTRCFASNSRIGSLFDYMRINLGWYLKVNFNVHSFSTISINLKDAGFSFLSTPFWLPTLRVFTIVKKKPIKNKYALVFNSDNYFLPTVIDSLLKQNLDMIDCVFEVPFKANKQYLFANIRILTTSFIVRLLSISSFKHAISFFLIPIKTISINTISVFHGIKYFKIKSVNEKKFNDLLHQEGIDVVLSFCSEIYKLPILKQDEIQFYNFHPSILPNNKGRFPIFWAIYKSEKQGVTCHQIDKDIDSGKILFQQTMELKRGLSMDKVLVHYIKEFPNLVSEAIHHIEADKYGFQDSTINPFYGPVPTKEQIKKYKEIISSYKSLKLI